MKKTQKNSWLLCALLMAILLLVCQNLTLSKRLEALEEQVETRSQEMMRNSVIHDTNGMILEKYLSANYDEQQGSIDLWIELVPAEQSEDSSLYLVCNGQKTAMQRRGTTYLYRTSVSPDSLCMVTEVIQVSASDVKNAALQWTIRPCELVFPRCESSYCGRGGVGKGGEGYQYSGTITWKTISSNILRAQVVSAQLIQMADGEEIERKEVRARQDKSGYHGEKKFRVSVTEGQTIEYLLVLTLDNGVLLKHTALRIEGEGPSQFYCNQGTEVSSTDFGWSVIL